MFPQWTVDIFLNDNLPRLRCSQLYQNLPLIILLQTGKETTFPKGNCLQGGKNQSGRNQGIRLLAEMILNGKFTNGVCAEVK